MASVTVENYLKQLYFQQQPAPGEMVPTGRLATAMDVTPGTATSMVKALADSGLVRYEPREGVRLTRAGEQLALHVLRRHRLVELFLVKIVGLDWSEVHEEAEELEHAISDKLLDRIDLLLGHPQADPHGDPIPSAKGKVSEPRLATLAEAVVGKPLRVARVTDQAAEFLQFLDRCGITPGVSLVIDRKEPAADSIVVRPANGPIVTLGMGAAVKILVDE
jgi:DtxR family Mn-dependent transcriptional regulator